MPDRARLNSAGMKELLNSSEVAGFLSSRIGNVLNAAKANSPVASGAYRDSLHVEVVHTDRVVARVVADVPYSLVVEAATGNLARALDQAGGS